MAEIPTKSDDSNFIIAQKGMFVAPVTGEYRFLVSADDVAELYLSNTVNSSSNSSLQKIANVPSYTAYRNYF